MSQPPENSVHLKKKSGCLGNGLKFLWFGGLAFIGLATIGHCMGGGGASGPSGYTEASETASETAFMVSAGKGDAVSEVSSNWNYRDDVDEMNDSTIHFAIVESDNTLNLDFPYHGKQHARLTVRKHPRHGNDIVLTIEQGQFNCRSAYDDCTILVRFDDAAPSKFSVVGSADGGTTDLFVTNYTRFYQSLKKSKRVLIQAEIYDNGNPTMEFNTAGFDEKQFLGTNIKK